MTFCLAFAAPRFAFLAADTRGWILGSSGPPRIVENVRKISPLAGGWAVTGNRVDVSAAVVRAIADSAADSPAIATRLAAARPSLLQRIYSLPARDVVAILSQPTSVWILSAEASGGLTCRRFDWLSGEIDADQGVLVMPLGGDPTEIMALVDRGLARIQEATRAGYLAGIRRLATIFQLVADRLGPRGAVSNHIEIGALWRDDAGQVITEHLPPTATQSVRRASDDELEAMLSQSAVPVMRVGMLKAIASVASGLAQMMVGNAADQIAQALAHPAAAGQHLAAAGKFFGAAAIFGALSGAMSGAAANTAGGGGSPGGSPGATTAASATDKGSGTIVIQGGLLDMSDPRQADAFSQAVSDLTGRGVIVQAGQGD